MNEFLTAVFELHPTFRAAATLERTRAANEEAYWDALAGAKEQADMITAMPLKKRGSAVRAACKHIRSIGAKRRLTEMAFRELQRDVEAIVSAYVERRTQGQVATWPERGAADRPGIDYVLDQLASAIVAEDESAASVALEVARRAPVSRGLAFTRLQDARIVKDPAGGIAVRLNCVATAAARPRPAAKRSGTNVTGAEPAGEEKTKSKSRKSKPSVVVSLSCSESDKEILVKGAMRPRFSLVFRHADKWFIAVRFEVLETIAAPMAELPGIDVQAQVEACFDVERRPGVSDEIEITRRPEAARLSHASGGHGASGQSTSTSQDERRQPSEALAAAAVAPGALLAAWAPIATVSGGATGAMIGLILAVFVAALAAGFTYVAVSAVRNEIRTMVAVILCVSINFLCIAILVMVWPLFLNMLENMGAGLTNQIHTQ